MNVKDISMVGVVFAVLLVATSAEIYQSTDTNSSSTTLENSTLSKSLSTAEGSTPLILYEESSRDDMNEDYMELFVNKNKDTVTTATPGVGALLVSLLLPLLLGLGAIEATSLSATILHLVRSYKGRIRRLVPWHPTVATVMALAWAAQMVIVAGLLSVCLRMRAMVRDGSIGQADHFSAFSASANEYNILGPIIFVTPVVAFLYWTVLTVASRIKMAKLKEVDVAVISEAAILRSEK